MAEIGRLSRQARNWRGYRHTCIPSTNPNFVRKFSSVAPCPAWQTFFSELALASALPVKKDLTGNQKVPYY